MKISLENWIKNTGARRVCSAIAESASDKELSGLFGSRAGDIYITDKGEQYFFNGWKLTMITDNSKEKWKEITIIPPEKEFSLNDALKIIYED